MTKHIVVIGAGYAGMMAALRVSGKNRRQPVQVTLVNPVDYFVERLRMHQLATNQTLSHLPLSQLLNGTGIQFVQGYVTHIDPQQRIVSLENRTLAYDYLVYALGSMIDRTSVPGVQQHAYVLNVSGERSTTALCEQLLALPTARVVVCGGGATGIEAAAEIADQFPQTQVTLVTQGASGAFKTPRVKKVLDGGLKRLKVKVIENTRITEVRANEVVCENGGTLPFEVCVWAGGFKALPLAQESGLTVNERLQILVDPYLRSVSHPTIYAAGDSGQPIRQPGAPYRMSVFAALVSGAHAADNLTRVIRGKNQQPLGFSYYGQAVAIGSRDAVGFATFPDDQPLGPLYTGWLAVQLRAFFVWFLKFALKLERRMPGFFFWLGKGRGRSTLKQPASIVSGQEA